VTETFQLNYMKVADFEKFLASNRSSAGAGAGQTATTGGQGRSFRSAASSETRARTS
jgi:hypothetical protein